MVKRSDTASETLIPYPNYPFTTVAGTSEGTRNVEQILKDPFVRLLRPSDGDSIVSFILALEMGAGGGLSLRSNSAKFTDKMIQYISKEKPGNKLIIENVRVQAADSTIQPARGVVIKISEGPVKYLRNTHSGSPVFAEKQAGDMIAVKDFTDFKFIKVRSEKEKVIITSFTLKAPDEEKELRSESNQITKKMTSYVKALEPGSRIWFRNITAKTAAGERVSIVPFFLILSK